MISLNIYLRKLLDFRKIKLYIILVLTAFIIIVMFKRLALLPIYFVVGYVLGYYTTLLGKFIPHVTTETMTSMSILAGLLFGYKIGFLFGVLVSLIVYSALGLIKMTTILNSFVISTGGIFSAFFITQIPNVSLVFCISLLLRSIVGVLVFWNITSDKIEAVAHAVIDPLWNFFIYMPIMIPFYSLLVMI